MVTVFRKEHKCCRCVLLDVAGFVFMILLGYAVFLKLLLVFVIWQPTHTDGLLALKKGGISWDAIIICMAVRLSCDLSVTSKGPSGCR